MDELYVMRKATLLTEFGDDIRVNEWGQDGDEYYFDDIDDLEEINQYYVKNYGCYFNIMPSTILEIKRNGFEMPEPTPVSDDDY